MKAGVVVCASLLLFLTFSSSHATGLVTKRRV